jgi:site-specific DNA-methyltransferase (adenine-specific)
MAYVYLKNKTFLNAHLIKNGFVEVEFSYNFKHKNRFIKYSKEGII